jgi:hypothetical protein
MDASQMRARQGKRAKGADAGAEPQKRERPTPVATAMTDSEGRFMVNDVKAGEYMVIAMVKGEGRGRVHTSISAGQTANVEIQIMPGGGKNGLNKNRAGKAGKVRKGQQI